MTGFYLVLILFSGPHSSVEHMPFPHLLACEQAAEGFMKNLTPPLRHHVFCVDRDDGIVLPIVTDGVYWRETIKD